MQQLAEEYFNSIKDWREKNPNGRQIDCMRALNFSRTTIHKYWHLCGIDDKTPKDIISDWKKNNPKGLKAWCVYDTNLSFPTVNKYW